MNFSEYQERALTNENLDADDFNRLMAVVLGVADEDGEVQSLFKKWIRDDGADPEKLPVGDIKKELGDVFWYIAVTAQNCGIDLQDIAQYNVDKLKSRNERGVLGGNGDNR